MATRTHYRSGGCEPRVVLSSQVATPNSERRSSTGATQVRAVQGFFTAASGEDGELALDGLDAEQVRGVLVRRFVY